MTDLIKHLLACRLISPGDHVICAVSGGADSMALLRAMQLCAPELGIRVSAAHFNHRLRGSDSDSDEQFVRSYCIRNHIECYFGSEDVGAYASTNGMSIEQAARTLRYRFLDSLDCDRIATAHHANDNAETILMNLISGTGLRGLCGIPEQRGRYIRPFLALPQEELLQFLQTQQIDHVEDASNRDNQALRNRIRHDLMPLMLRENPDWLHSVLITSRQLQADEQTLRTQTELMLNASRIEGGFSSTVLCALPDGLRQRALRMLLEECGVARPGHRHVELLERLIHATSPSSMICLPGGLIAQRRYDLLCFDPPARCSWSPVPLDSNGTVCIPELGYEISCCPAERIENTKTTYTVIPVGQIIARPRMNGDRIQLSGGSKSLKKLMIDRKIPRLARDLLPVLEDENGLLAVYSIGADRQRIGSDGAITITIKKMEDDAL